MRTLVLLLLGAVFVAAEPRNQQRIVGGTTTTITQYPYMAALLRSPTATTFWQSCGGSIITTSTILSAAHCFIGDTERNWRIRVGSTYANSGGTVFATSRIIRHPSYSQFSYNHDVALLKAQGTFVLGNNVQLGVIAGGNYFVPDNAVVWAAGWGDTSFNGVPSEQLRHVQVWTVNQDVCRSRYGSVITDNMLCSGWLDVGGRDQCQGDSGGPLLHNNVIVGISSFGKDCALAYYPGVNARVSRYTSWIQSNA